MLESGIFNLIPFKPSYTKCKPKFMTDFDASLKNSFFSDEEKCCIPIPVDGIGTIGNEFD